MTNTLAVGSAAWTNGREYDFEYAERIVQFLKYTREDALCAYASRLRNGISCVVCSGYAVGRHNMVRLLRFDDGVQWVARMRMPPIWGDEEPSAGALNVSMSSELATMAFVRQNTEIKVPEVYGFDLDIDNEVGCVFVLMEYIPGSTADDLSQRYFGSVDHHMSMTFIPPQFQDKFWRQLADVMARLAAVRLPKIGSIYRESTNPGAFAAGPIAETLSGPYDTAAAFYRDFPARVGGKPELIQAFARAAATFRPDADADAEEEESRRGGFGLANYNLNPNNILVDAEFSILAIIDWSAVVALPEAALHRLPQHMGFDVAIPGVQCVADVDAARRGWNRGRRFAETAERQVREAEGEGERKGVELFPFTAAGFYAREAVAFRALVELWKKQGHRVDRWSRSAIWAERLVWLAEHSDEELTAFYKEH